MGALQVWRTKKGVYFVWVLYGSNFSFLGNGEGNGVIGREIGHGYGGSWGIEGREQGIFVWVLYGGNFFNFSREWGRKWCS